MSQKTDPLDTLIQATFQGPVFGRNIAFGTDASANIPTIKKQIAEISQYFKTELTQRITDALPSADTSTIARLLAEITPKSVTFCPALTAGELTGRDNTRRLAGTASAIGIMYFADQSVDRGDEHMAEAIDYLCGKKQPRSVPPEVTSRLSALRHIRTNIETFALPEDVPFVLDCYDQQVLMNEVALHRLSNEYAQISPTKQQAFLDQAVDNITDRMISDAGFPSVTASLYAAYRHQDRSLTPLADVHNDPDIKPLLRLCNVVVRVADELGDYDIDAGHHPEWGTFSINPFNQYHPRFFELFCEQARLRDPLVVEHLQRACREFPRADVSGRSSLASSIAAILFDHARQTFNTLPADLVARHTLYIQLCKRVLEIGHVNMVGDRALAGFS
jgi:hypothetical protein